MTVKELNAYLDKGVSAVGLDAIIHCDTCLSICMRWQNFCSCCRKPTHYISWGACELESEMWAKRERLRDGKGSGSMSFIHCDSCYSVIGNIENFCGFCGKRVCDIAWNPVDLDTEAGKAEFHRREELRAKADTGG